MFFKKVRKLAFFFVCPWTSFFRLCCIFAAGMTTCYFSGRPHRVVPTGGCKRAKRKVRNSSNLPSGYPSPLIRLTLFATFPRGGRQEGCGFIRIVLIKAMQTTHTNKETPAVPLTAGVIAFDLQQEYKATYLLFLYCGCFSFVYFSFFKKKSKRKIQ